MAGFFKILFKKNYWMKPKKKKKEKKIKQ